MSAPLINSPDALDAASAAALQSRRERLLRVAEGKGVRVRLAFGGPAIVGLCAVVALFAGDKSAATILAFEFCLLVTFVILAMSSARRKARKELAEMKSN